MAPEQSEINLHQYAELRMILDSVERGALRHYLQAPTQAKRDASFKYLKEKLKVVHNHVWGRTQAQPCPPGYFDCNGCCVDYPCFLQYGLESATSRRE